MLPLFTVLDSFRLYGISSRYHLEEGPLLVSNVRLTLALKCPMDFNTCGEDLGFILGVDTFQAAKNCINHT